MRGRRAELKAIEGGLMSAAPPPPPDLPDDIRPEWERIVADLVDRRLLTESALGAIAAYVTSVWLVNQCRRTLAADGLTVKTKTGEAKAHPILGVMSKSLEQVARLAAELGLTPAARSRKALQIPDKGKGDAWADLDL